MPSWAYRLRGGAGRTIPARASRTRAGISLVEIVVALSVLVVAASIFCQMLLSTTRLRNVNRENVLAADAARVVLERMRNEAFLDVFHDYNEDPKDDPGGIGTGPGHLFDVAGLQPLDGAPGGKVGTLTFPSMSVQVPVGGKASFGGATKIERQLREDHTDAGLGMPRDLDGDNKIDSANHAANYLILPVRITLEWKSGNGARKFEIVTQLGDFRREDGS